ncbi:uncharacterized protein [Haliotis asinina]|uniref:uncharacterized protein n=1 Tax=Haliotis asinina TaxID=109174 RepID=UPI003531BC6A
MLLDIFKIFLCSSMKDILTSHSSNINVPGVQCIGTDCKKPLVCQSFEYNDVDQICTAKMKTVTCDEVRHTEDADSSNFTSLPSHRHCPGHFRCRRGESWEIVKVACVPHISFYRDPLPNKHGFFMDLGFNLQSGMRVTWELAQMNREWPPPRPNIFLGKPDFDLRIYMVSLRLWNRDPVVVFNTRLKGRYGTEKRSPGRKPQNNGHFVVDVKIGIGIFQIELDGSFLTSNVMRAPLARVRFVGVHKVTALPKIQVGFDKC